VEAAIYDSVTDCGEMLILEGTHHAVITLYCDECLEKHQFKLREIYVNEEEIFNYLLKTEEN
jgi:hypothetical protein